MNLTNVFNFNKILRRDFLKPGEKGCRGEHNRLLRYNIVAESYLGQGERQGWTELFGRV
jgi:hypothetical protein